MKSSLVVCVSSLTLVLSLLWPHSLYIYDLTYSILSFIIMTSLVIFYLYYDLTRNCVCDLTNSNFTSIMTSLVKYTWPHYFYFDLSYDLTRSVCMTSLTLFWPHSLCRYDLTNSILTYNMTSLVVYMTSLTLFWPLLWPHSLYTWHH